MDGSRARAGGGVEAPGLRTPPHSLEAERGVLASVLINNDLMNGVAEVLRAEDFYLGAHRALYSVMLDLYERNRGMDSTTLYTALRDRGLEEEVGGLPYLSELLQATASTFFVSEYARIVKEKAILRRTAATAQEIGAEALSGVADLDEFLDRVEQRIFAIAEEKIKPSFYSMNQMAKEAMREIEKAFERKEMITGVPSGFKDIDALTSGFQKSDLVIVAARPSMGKTSFCLNVAVNAALRHKVPVAIFSLEMSRQQLVQRVICSEARVNSNRLRTGFLAQDEINRLVAAVGRLSEAPIFIDDSGALTPLEMRAKARRLKRDQEIGLVIVDYLQLMRGSQRGAMDNRVQEVSEISRGLKSLAKELELPVIAISQLSRALESRENKRPQMSDLRDSGALEQDADLILFLYREEIYSRKGEPVPPNVKGTAELIVGKHRNGPTGTVPLTFLDQYTRFDDRARDYE